MTNKTRKTTKENAAAIAKRMASDVTDRTRDALGSAVEDAAEAAKKEVDAAKSSAANEISSAASALRTAAEEMRKGSLQQRTFGQMADGLADTSDALRNKDLNSMVQNLTVHAHNNPLMFLGGAMLVGFAAARFSKASNTTKVGLLEGPDTFSKRDFT